MKFLHLSDLHFNQYWFDWITKQQNPYDIFCISGDFLDTSLSIGLSEQISWVSEWMKAFEKPLFVCSGNHDVEAIGNENWLTKIPHVYADNTIKTIDGIRIGCMPYLGTDILEFADCDILLNHVPPAKTKTSTTNKNKDLGDMELYRLLHNKLLSPQYLLCGHIHDSISKTDKINNTIISNPNSGNKHKPNCLSVVLKVKK